MESSKEGQKVEAMIKKHKRGKFVYNLVLYTLTSLITCSVFTYPLLLPSMTMAQLLSFVDVFFNNISFELDAKCCFLIGNLIVLLLIWEPLLKGSSCTSPSLEIYDEYVARSRRNHDIQKASYSKETDGNVPTAPIIKEKNHGGAKSYLEEKNKKKKKTKREVLIKTCEGIPHHREERNMGMRSCKSESDIAKRGKAAKAAVAEKDEEEEEKKDCKTGIEELNIRVENFIARVNEKRLAEAKFMENDRG